MAIDVEKLALLRSIAGALAERELVDVNLLLHEAGLDEVGAGFWYDDRYDITSADRASRVLEVIRDLPRAMVDELALAVRQLFEVSVEIQAPREVRPLLLFASHLVAQKALVGEIGKYLDAWGITLFVAHDSIEPDDEWHAAIEKALRACDAGVVFLFPKFNASKWCDQEVGWLLGRGIPCYALKFQGEDPYGPLGKKQAFTVRDEMAAAQIGDVIIDWVKTKPALTSQLNASLVEALKGSWSFNRTDQVWAHLFTATDLGTNEVAGLLTAIRDNDQVYNAHGGIEGADTGPYAELAFKLAMNQPGFEANEQLAAEVARMRGLEALLPGSGTVPSAWPTPTSNPWGSFDDPF